MPIACRHKTEQGRQFCATDCPASAPCGVFRYQRIEASEDVPTADERVVDVAILDLNHGWPNLGHDSLVHAVLEVACDLLPLLQETGLALRVLSYDVRDRGMVPEPPGGRFALYLGTGGPGHLDPRRNDGVCEVSQGLREDPSWEGPAFRLFDAIHADGAAALLAVCHTFGVLCRWSGAARPVLRGPEKGGKLEGILENVLTPEAQDHPWFSRFAAELPGRRRLRVVDNRLFDLIPGPAAPRAGFLPIGYESGGREGAPGEALTMMELARDRGGVMPRIFAVNHHPEIVNRSHQMFLLQKKVARGEVTQEWADERVELLARIYRDEDSDQLHVTSEYTFLSPLRFHLVRQVRQRAEALGWRLGLHEDRMLEAAQA